MNSTSVIMTIGEALSTKWPAPGFILSPLQPGNVGILAGADGAGKSWIALAAAVTIAYGRSAGGIFSPPTPDMTGPVMLFAGEDQLDDHGRRLHALALEIRNDGIHIAPDDDRVKVKILNGERNPLFERSQGGATGRTQYQVTAYGRRWAEAIKPYRGVILDPLRMFHDLDESDGVGMDQLIRWLVQVAIQNQQVILLVHHSSQAAILGGREDHHVGRGATDLPAGCRGAWTLRAATPDEIKEGACELNDKVLVNSKANHAAAEEKLFLSHTHGGVLRRAHTGSLQTAKDGCELKVAAAAYARASQSGGDDDFGNF